MTLSQANVLTGAYGVLVGSVAQGGSGTVVLSSSQNYVGTTTIQAGILESTISANTPLGSGGVALNGGMLWLAPTAGTAALSGASAFAATTFSYGGSGILQLSNSVTYTVGNGTPSVAVLQRSGKGTLIIEPSALADLGVSEKFVVVGLSSTANLPAGGAGIYNATVVAQSVSGNSDTGSFVAYSTTASAGFRPAAYTTRNANVLIPPNEITDVVGSFLASNGSNPYALRIDASTLTNAGLTTVGNGDAGSNSSGVAGLILNPTSTTAQISGGMLAFGGAEAAIYVGSGAGLGRIDSNITGSAGVTKFGPGTLILTSGGNAYSGGTTVQSGVLQIGLGSAGGSLGSGNILDNGTLVFDDSGIAVNNNISGNGGLTVAYSTQGNQLTLTGSNTYSGATVVNCAATGGGLTASDGRSLPAASNLALDSGYLNTSGTFSRALGGGPGQLQISAGTAGFTAAGGPLTIAIGGAGTPTQLVWGSAYFNPSALQFQGAATTGAVTLANNIDLNDATRNIAMGSGSGTVNSQWEHPQ